jgi:hypothetical protein
VVGSTEPRGRATQDHRISHGAVSNPLPPIRVVAPLLTRTDRLEAFAPPLPASVPTNGVKRGDRESKSDRENERTGMCVWPVSGHSCEPTPPPPPRTARMAKKQCACRKRAVRKGGGERQRTSGYPIHKTPPWPKPTHRDPVTITIDGSYKFQ